MKEEYDKCVCGKTKKVSFPLCYECNMEKKPNATELKTANHYHPEDETKINSMVISYSKDLVVAGKISLSELESMANRIKQYIIKVRR